MPDRPGHGGSAELHETARLAERLGLQIRRRARALEKTAQAVRHAADEGAVHDFRVAVRRLDAALRLWAGSLDPDRRRRALARLRRLRRGFGPVRDLEIQRTSLAAMLPELPLESRVAGEMMMARLAKKLARRRDELGSRVRSGKIERLNRLAIGTPRNGAVRTGADVDPLQDARRRIEKVRSRLLKDAAEALASGEAPALHALRIRVKKSRYALESLSEALETQLSLEPLRALQAALGEIQDRVMLEGTVLRFARKLEEQDAATAARAIDPLLERIRSERTRHLEEARRLMDLFDARELFGSPLALVPGETGEPPRRVSGSTPL